MRLQVVCLLLACAAWVSATPTESPWVYEDAATGPANWKNNYPSCGATKGQSPINLSGGKPNKKLGPLEFTGDGCSSIYYAAVGGRNWEAEYHPSCEHDGASKLAFNGVEYNLLQFHFHSPSEHTIGGAYYDGEMHMVHKSEDGKKLLVVGIMLEAVGQFKYVSRYVVNP
jgi:carbonic anhydrase